MQCKVWSQPDPNHIRGLCANKFQSEDHGANCSVCAVPLAAEAVSTCGCPSPLKELKKVYRLTVTPGPLGSNPATLAAYGTFYLTGDCGAGMDWMPLAPGFPANFFRWSVEASSVPFLASLKYWKTPAIYLRSAVSISPLTGELVQGVWSVDSPLAACNNTIKRTSGATHNRTSSDDLPGSNPFYPDVFEDQYALVISQL